MTKTATILIITAILLSSCRRRNITETSEIVTTSIDTAVIIPPKIIDGTFQLHEIITPQSIENDRVKITVLRDTIYNTVKVNAECKTDTVIVQKTEVIERKSSEIKPQPKRVSRWRWFLYGAAFVIIARFIYRVYVYTNIPNRPRF